MAYREIACGARSLKLHSRTWFTSETTTRIHERTRVKITGSDQSKRKKDLALCGWRTRYKVSQEVVFVDSLMFSISCPLSSIVAPHDERTCCCVHKC